MEADNPPPQVQPTTSTFISATFCEGRSISGYIVDKSDPSREFIVELILDDWPAQIARADCFDHRLAQTGHPHPWHGFVFNLPDAVIATTDSAYVRIANTGIPVGETIRLSDLPPPVEAALGPGQINWSGGLRFEGWCAGSVGSDSLVRCFIEEDLVAEVVPRGWTLLPRGNEGVAVPRLDLHLPLRFADGNVRQVDVRNQDGLALHGSPLTFVAFADGLEDFLRSFIDEPGDLEGARWRARLFDARSPQSFPFTWIEEWMRWFPLVDVGTTPDIKVAVILFGETDISRTLDSLKNCSEEWILGALPLDQHDGRFDPQELVEFLTEASDPFEYIVFAPSGTTFHKQALQHLVRPLIDAPRAIVSYADIIVTTKAGELLPLAWPDFDYERMLEQGYGAYLFAMQRSPVLAAAAAGADSAFRLFNFGLDQDNGPEASPCHRPGFLATVPAPDVERDSDLLADATAAHLGGGGFDVEIRPAPCATMPAIRLRRIIAADRITIVIPTHDRLDLLRPTIEGLQALETRHSVEFVVVDIATTDKGALAYLAQIEGSVARVIRIAGGFNRARAFNLGAAASSSRFLAFLDSSVILPSEGWLDELMSRVADPHVAAAGGLLTWPSGVIRSAGGVLGPNFGVSDACVGYGDADLGYGDMLGVARSCSVLSAEALITKRSDFLSAGGFDERAFAQVFYSADYCLKLRAKGRRLIFTPHVRAMQLRDDAQTSARYRAESAAVFERELNHLRSRWGRELADDPFYSPLLSLNGSLWSALAWPVRESIRSGASRGLDVGPVERPGD